MYDTYNTAGELVGQLDAGGAFVVYRVASPELERALAEYGACGVTEVESGEQFYLVAHGALLPARLIHG